LYYSDGGKDNFLLPDTGKGSPPRYFPLPVASPEGCKVRAPNARTFLLYQQDKKNYFFFGMKSGWLAMTRKIFLTGFYT